jgi:hypothetical protein
VASELTLSDGTRSVNLVGSSADGLYLTEFNPPIVAHENTYAGGADSEGRTRVRTQPLNPEFSARLRINESSGTTADLANTWGDIQDLIHSTHHNKGTLRYTPITGGTAVTYDLESCRLSDAPQVGWEIAKRRGELQIDFEAKPYGRLDPIVVVNGDTITGPVDGFAVPSVPGHVDALGSLTLQDTSSVTSDFVEYSLTRPEDYVVGADDHITHADFGISGGGTLIADVDAYGGTAVRKTASTTETLLATKGDLTHKGPKRIQARVKASSDAWVRFYWGVGNKPAAAGERWVFISGDGVYRDLHLGTINIEPTTGTHEWNFWIQVRNDTAASSGISINYVTILGGQRGAARLGTHALTSVYAAHVMWGGDQVVFDHEGVISEDGTPRWSPVPMDGQPLLVPPATNNGLSSYIQIRRRTNDIDLANDPSSVLGTDPLTGLDDGCTAWLTVTPRVLLIPAA